MHILQRYRYHVSKPDWRLSARDVSFHLIRWIIAVNIAEDLTRSRCVAPLWLHDYYYIHSQTIPLE
jgi:hypothetical protein